MGDILAGILGTFLAQGLPPLDTACLGVYLHGLASDRVAKTKARGQIASDLLEEIPHLIREYGDLRVYQ
jgi:NAD(P)H-hydrate epimerase